jgi:hypothetical protein
MFVSPDLNLCYQNYYLEYIQVFHLFRQIHVQYRSSPEALGGITPRLLRTPIIGVSLLSDLLTREKKILRSCCKTTFLEQDLMSNLFDSRNLCFCYKKIAVFVLRKCVRLFENKSMFLFEGELYGVTNIFSNAFEERTPIYSHNKIFLIYNICSVVQNPK